MEGFDAKTFFEQMREQQPKSASSFAKSERKVEVLNLSVPTNFGKYQIAPISTALYDVPFIKLENTREIRIPFTYKAADGTEKQGTNWIKIPMAECYQMRDSEGRRVSSLTAVDENLHRQVCAVWEELFAELDGKNNRAVTKNLMRRKNYNIGFVHVLNKWDIGNVRQPSRSNFTVLLSCTARDMVTKFQEDIENKSLNFGGDYEWVSGIYGRDFPGGRTGYVMFSINMPEGQKGYSITADHIVNPGRQVFEGMSIDPELMEMMQNPLEVWLGRQANWEEGVAPEKRRLFNTTVMKQALEYMTNLLAKIRMEKSSGKSQDMVINELTAAITGQQQYQSPATNDPMLAAQQAAAMQQQGHAVDPQKIQQGNVDPFTGVPPVAHVDPFGAMSAPQAAPAPFSKPDFAIGTEESSDDLPF